MKYKVVSLVLLFSVLLVGVSFAQDSHAAVHPFELQWGESGTKSGKFLHPQQLAIDSENNIFVTDRDNSRVQKFNDQGNYIRSWKLHTVLNMDNLDKSIWNCRIQMIMYL